MKVNEINIVTSLDGDWVGVYLNGEIETQGHSIGIWELVDILKTITGVGAKRQDFDFESAGLGTLPARYGELPQEYLD